MGVDKEMCLDDPAVSAMQSLCKGVSSGRAQMHASTAGYSLLAVCAIWSMSWATMSRMMLLVGYRTHQ